MKKIYLVIFIIGLLFVFNNPIGLLGDTILDLADTRTTYTLISFFGLCGFFIEHIFQKLIGIRKIDNQITDKE